LLPFRGGNQDAGHVATVGESRMLVVFSLDEVNEMNSRQ
jgi:hypothetical protein